MKIDDFKDGQIVDVTLFGAKRKGIISNISKVSENESEATYTVTISSLKKKKRKSTNEVVN